MDEDKHLFAMWANIVGFACQQAQEYPPQAVGSFPPQ